MREKKRSSFSIINSSSEILLLNLVAYILEERKDEKKVS